MFRLGHSRTWFILYSHCTVVPTISSSLMTYKKLELEFDADKPALHGLSGPLEGGDNGSDADEGTDADTDGARI